MYGFGFLVGKKLIEKIVKSIGAVFINEGNGKVGNYQKKFVKSKGANLLGYSCIIDRSDKKILIKDKIISQIKFKIDTFKADELPDKLKKITPIKPGSRSLSK